MVIWKFLSVTPTLSHSLKTISKESHEKTGKPEWVGILGT